MSADNGIYILETPSLVGDKEYRVIHAQAIDNIYDQDGNIDKDTLRQYFCMSPVIVNKEDAMTKAFEWEKDIIDEWLPVEYGVHLIKYDSYFPV